MGSSKISGREKRSCGLRRGDPRREELHELGLLDLPAVREWKLVARAEEHVARHLVGGKLAAQPLAQRIRRQASALIQHYGRRHVLTALRVRNTDHEAGLHLGLCLDDDLDFSRRNVGPTGLDDLAEAIRMLRDREDGVIKTLITIGQ